MQKFHICVFIRTQNVYTVHTINKFNWKRSDLQQKKKKISYKHKENAFGSHNIFTGIIYTSKSLKPIFQFAPVSFFFHFDIFSDLLPTENSKYIRW